MKAETLVIELLRVKKPEFAISFLKEEIESHLRTLESAALDADWECVWKSWSECNDCLDRIRDLTRVEVLKRRKQDGQEWREVLGI